MTKLKDDPITEKDLNEFLDQYSDFSFELQVLSALLEEGFKCEHGGSYSDPSTDKMRGFDIRATLGFNGFYLRLAVECKNLRANCPLLVCCVPRREEEAFHQVVACQKTGDHRRRTEKSGEVPKPVAKPFGMDGVQTLYGVFQPVGKSCDQVGRRAGGEFATGNSGVYAKWSQALSSAGDLVRQAYEEEPEIVDLAVSLILPVLVVPNGQLWAVEYDLEGNRKGPPMQVKRRSYFVNQPYDSMGPPYEAFTVSHLEFVTMEGLLELASQFRKGGGKFSPTAIFREVGRRLMMDGLVP